MCRKSSFTATASLVLLWLSSAATLVFAHCLYSSFLMICENFPDFQGAIFIPAQLMSNGEQPQVCWQLEEMWGCSSIPLCHTMSHLSHAAGQDRDSPRTGIQLRPDGFTTHSNSQTHGMFTCDPKV